MSNEELAIKLDKCFSFSDQKIKVCGTVETPWFCGKDVAKVLGYKDTKRALSRHADTDDKTSLSDILRVGDVSSPPENLNKNDLKTIYINESGLYSLILRSKLDTAKDFKKWVTKEVLPSIRKTGQYKINEEMKEIKTQLKLTENELEISKREVESSQEKLSLTQSQLEEAQRRTLMLNNFVTNIKQRETDQFLYIATTKQYAANNHFKVGGSNSLKNLKSRLNTYNTGRPDNDLYYYAYYAKVSNYKGLEYRIKDILQDFQARKETEMYIMHFECLKSFVELLLENYNEEIAELNEFIRNMMTEMIDRKPTVPDEIILGRKATLLITENGEEKESKVFDMDNLNEEEILSGIKNCLRKYAEDRKISYDYEKDKDQKELQIIWKDFQKYLISQFKIPRSKFKALEWKSPVKKINKGADKLKIRWIKGKR